MFLKHHAHNNCPRKGGLFLQNIQLPHLHFHSMYKNHKELFFKHFWPQKPHSLSSFWQKFSKHISMKEHPALQREDSFNLALPLKIHGDAMPVTGIGKVWSKGMLVMSWSGLLNNASSRENCYVMYVAAGLQKFLFALWCCFLAVVLVTGPQNDPKIFAKRFPNIWSIYLINLLATYLLSKYFPVMW